MHTDRLDECQDVAQEWRKAEMDAKPRSVKHNLNYEICSDVFEALVFRVSHGIRYVAVLNVSVFCILPSFV